MLNFLTGMFVLGFIAICMAAGFSCIKQIAKGVCFLLDKKEAPAQKNESLMEEDSSTIAPPQELFVEDIEVDWSVYATPTFMRTIAAASVDLSESPETETAFDESFDEFYDIDPSTGLPYGSYV